MEGDLLANEPPLSPDRFARAMAKVDWQSVHAEMRAKTGLDGDHSPRKPACDEATDPPASRKPTRDELERLVAVYDAALEESNQIRIALAERVEALEAEAATRIRAEKDERIALDERIGALQAEVDAMRDALGDMARYARRMRREEAAKEREKEEEPRPPSPFEVIVLDKLDDDDAKPSEGGGPVPAPAPEVPEVPTASPGARKRMRVSMSDSPGTPPGASADSPEAETSDVGDVLIRRKKATEAEATEAAELLLDRLKKASEAAELYLLSDEMTCEPLIKYNLAATICGLDGDNRADVNMVRQRVREMRRINVENNQTDATERREMQEKLLKAAQLYVVYKSLKHKVTHVSAAQELGLDETSEDSVRKYAQLYQNADVNKLRWTLSWLPWEGPMEPWRKEEVAWMKAQEEWFKAKAEESRRKKPAGGGEKEEMSPEPDEEVDVEAIQKQQEEEDDDEEEEEEEGRETGPGEGPAAERAGVAVKLEPDFDDARRTAPSARMDDERCVVS